VPRPRRVDGAIRRARIAHIAAGAHHSVASDGDGAWAFGSNWTRQLGMRDVPAGPTGAAALAASPPPGADAHIVWLPRRMDALPAAIDARAGVGAGSGGSGGGGAFSVLGGDEAAAEDAAVAAARIVQVAAADTYTLALT